VTLDPTSGYRAGSPAPTPIRISYQPSLDPNVRRPGYPVSISIVFDDVVRDTSIQSGQFTAKPAKFVVIAHTAQGDQQLNFRFRDSNNDGWLSYIDVDGTTPDSTELIDIVTYLPSAPNAGRPTWRIEFDTAAKGPVPPPRLGDIVDIRVQKPLGDGDVFTFTAHAKGVDLAAAKQGFETRPYVVPNPYVGAASFEPARFATSGRGDRRIEFRGIPANSTVRVYNVRGDLIQTLRQDGSDAGMVAWDLRTKDNLDLAPGLYIFHVDAPGVGTHVGKFAVVK